ncbi:MAG TPA: hypothetical protein EYG97_04745 [Arcobacter sp.]|nr:hypothetical protein [Arcobacter sp.]HIP56314.1 hypothetical protein [Arcobacter sp.]
MIGFGVYKDLNWEDLSLEYLYGLSDSNNVLAIKEIQRRTSLSIEEQKVGFGKHIGLLWIDLDISYLNWIISTMDPMSDKALLANEAIEYKKSIQDLDLIYDKQHTYEDDEVIIQYD